MAMRFVWARNRNAAGRGRDPMPQIIHENVGCAHLEIVAEHDIPDFVIDRRIDALVNIFPAPPGVA
jgi:hypothetical protein